MALVLLSASFQSLPPLPTIKLGPSSAASRVRGCVCSRPLWVSPANSPVRLQVSPAATPTPTGVFNQRFEALFPPHWSPGLCGLLCSLPFVRFICARVWGHGVLPTALPALLSATLESGPLSLSVCECGVTGSASARTAGAVRPTLCQSQSRHSHRSPLQPGARLRPSYQSG